MNGKSTSQEGGSAAELTGTAPDQIRGELIRLVENGAWCWYQDERVVADPKTGVVFIGSTANRFGAGGVERDGDIDVTVFDSRSGECRTHTVRRGLTSYGAGDDHNSPALWLRPDGGCVVVYAGHNNDHFSYFGILRDGRWSGERKFDWRTKSGGSNFQTTYSNLFYLEAEKRLYNFARSHDRSPNFIVSEDFGETWSYGGQLTRAADDVGYVNGYFKYATNGTDRIEFVGTEHHPRDFNTSLYHGFLKDGKTYRSDGGVVHEDVGDGKPPRIDEFTCIVRAGTEIGGVSMTRLWNLDVKSYADGRIAVLFQARANDSELDHRFFRALFDGTEWKSEPLCHSGPKLFAHEEDYTGCAALDPGDPDVLYVSTPIDPRDGASLARHELFRGARGDDGWQWTPITWNSSRGNFRPVVVQLDGARRGIFWWRGTFEASQRYDAEVVGIIDAGG